MNIWQVKWTGKWLSIPFCGKVKIIFFCDLDFWCVIFEDMSDLLHGVFVHLCLKNPNVLCWVSYGPLWCVDSSLPMLDLCLVWVSITVISMCCVRFFQGMLHCVLNRSSTATAICYEIYFVLLTSRNLLIMLLVIL